MHEEGTRLMTQRPTYQNSSLAHPNDARERKSAMSVQSETSRTKGLFTKSCGYRAMQLSYVFKALNSPYSPFDVDCPVCLYMSSQN